MSFPTTQSVILMFEMLISIRIVRHVPPLLVNLLIALFKISTPKIVRADNNKNLHYFGHQLASNVLGTPLA